MRIQFLTAILAALTSTPILQAQNVSSGPDPDRRASTVSVSSESTGTLAAVSISYSAPRWQETYDEVLRNLQASNYTRLGKGWWTTFDTVRALEIGGTKIEAGSYYLGLSVNKDGAFTLLIFDSKQTMKAGLLPGTTALYTGEAKADSRAPLSLAKDALKETVVSMEIEISMDAKDPVNGRFAIRWGRHELSAPVKFQLGAAKEATPRKQ